MKDASPLSRSWHKEKSRRKAEQDFFFLLILVLSFYVFGVLVLALGPAPENWCGRRPCFMEIYFIEFAPAGWSQRLSHDSRQRSEFWKSWRLRWKAPPSSTNWNLTAATHKQVDAKFKISSGEIHQGFPMEISVREIWRNSARTSFLNWQIIINNFLSQLLSQPVVKFQNLL